MKRRRSGNAEATRLIAYATMLFIVTAMALAFFSRTRHTMQSAPPPPAIDMYKSMQGAVGRSTASDRSDTARIEDLLPQ